MSLPTPNLDDRTFEQIFEEAKRKIPELCPQWTDFHESDPGITLLQLMAWMAEMIIYRLNRVPDKNYIKFLELMGVNLKLPKPSQAWVVFTVAAAAKEGGLEKIPAGTRISTRDSEPIVFETVDDINPTSSRIIKVCSRYGERYADHTENITRGEEVPIFFGERYLPHILYLGFSYPKITKGAHLKINVKVGQEPPLPLTVEWECWDGELWSTVKPIKDGTSGFTNSGEIVFEYPANISETGITDKRSLWIRARAMVTRTLETGEEIKPRYLWVKKGIEIPPIASVPPEQGYLSRELSQPPIPARVSYGDKDLSKEFSPFDAEPKQNDVFYIGSWVFSIGGSKVSIKVEMSDSYISPTAIEDLKLPELHWEYYSESGIWKLLGVTAPTGVIKSEHSLFDETDAFTRSGTISFNYPEDIAPFSIQGQENFWVRARIARGSYGAGGANSPIIKSLSISFEENPKDFKHYVSDNYFIYEDLTLQVKGGEPIEPFQFKGGDPALYLAFDIPLAAGKFHRIHFRLAEEGEIDLSRITKEYFSKEEGWKELKILTDTTKYFSRGVVEFEGPYDWEKSENFGREGYWLRARWRGATYDRPPRLVGVHLNAVEAIQLDSIRPDGVLGSSNGEAYQVFSFANAPIIPYRQTPRILVKEEGAYPKDIERPEKSKKALPERGGEEDRGGVISPWIEWKRAEENFFKSGPEDRHYVLDPYKGTITFGNGIRGKIPPAGANNIKCDLYYIGGGVKGNVERNTITVLETVPPFIESATNPDPARGGAEAETIEEAKLSGPWTLKHRHRAVTKEDFEKLAEEASPEVGKAWCFANGEIKVIIVPKEDPREDKLEPSEELRQAVQDYLDERRLITTILKVEKPKYKPIFIEAVVVVSPQKMEVGKDAKERREHMEFMMFEMKSLLKRFFHPLIGGPEKKGWPLGRHVHISEIYYLLESVEGVDVVDKVWFKDKKGEKGELLRNEEGGKLEKIRMIDEKGDMYFPYLEMDIKITAIEE